MNFIAHFPGYCVKLAKLRYRISPLVSGYILVTLIVLAGLIEHQ